MSADRLKIFISSVQKELATERRAVKDFITRDPLLSRFISDVFLFEDISARDRKPDDIYLSEVEQRDIYLAIFGDEYGGKYKEGKSPTELEFEHATKTHRERLIFVKGDVDSKRSPEMAALVRKAGKQITRRRFSDIPELVREVYASLADSLENRGALRTTPFDNSICERATLKDVDNKMVEEFIETAETAGRLKLRGHGPRKPSSRISICCMMANPRMPPYFFSERIQEDTSTMCRSIASTSMEQKSENPSRLSSRMRVG